MDVTRELSRIDFILTTCSNTATIIVRFVKLILFGWEKTYTIWFRIGFKIEH